MEAQCRVSGRGKQALGFEVNNLDQRRRSTICWSDRDQAGPSQPMGHKSPETEFSSLVKDNQNSLLSRESEHRSNPPPSKEVLWLTSCSFCPQGWGDRESLQGGETVIILFLQKYDDPWKTTLQPVQTSPEFLQSLSCCNGH